MTTTTVAWEHTFPGLRTRDLEITIRDGQTVAQAVVGVTLANGRPIDGYDQAALMETLASQARAAGLTAYQFLSRGQQLTCDKCDDTFQMVDLIRNDDGREVCPCCAETLDR